MVQINQVYFRSAFQNSHEDYISNVLNTITMFKEWHKKNIIQLSYCMNDTQD